MLRRLIVTMGSQRRPEGVSTAPQIEDRRREHARASQQWLSLLRELESEGKTTDSSYDTYYRAYLKSREQEKHAELQLFNLHQGLLGEAHQLK